jgi:nitrite reductase/ring-hydroxylating ferredoxin subunit
MKVWSVVFLLLLFSCKEDLYDDPIPPAFFDDIIIDLSFPEYAQLRIDGGIYEVNNKGVKGVIISRKSAGNYVAFERNCSLRPFEACATVEVDPSRLFLTDFCCGSTFSLEDGTPVGGPAWRPLRIYKSSLQGFLLTITDESANGM